MGYKSVERTIALASGEKYELNLSLEEDVFGLEQVVVTATRNHLNRLEAPVLVSVSDGRLMDAVQAVSLSEGLNFQPGLRMETTCQNCGSSSVRMNGLQGEYSQILIDSRPVFSALNSVYGLEQIPSNMIERIEVVRGGGSALYGSSAIAGTINIITKEPVENNWQVGLNGASINGGAGDYSLNANTSLISKDYKKGLSIYGMARNRSAYDHDGDGFSEMTRLQNYTLGGKAYYKPTDNAKLSLDFHVLNEYRRGGDHLNLEPHEAQLAEELKSNIFGGGLTWEQFFPENESRYALYVTGQHTHMDNYYGASGAYDDPGWEPDLRGYGLTKDYSVVSGGQYSNNFAEFLGGEGVFTGGAEYINNKLTEKKPGYQLDEDQIIHSIGVYAQQEWMPIESLRFLFGLRYDYHSLAEEAQFNPRFNMMYKINSELRMRASYARGFRAPQKFSADTHAEVVAGGIRRIVLSDDLESEISNSLMLSFDYVPNWDNFGGQFLVEAFYTRINNVFINEYLQSDGPDAAILEKRNGEGAFVGGVNFEVKYAPVPQLLLQMGATYQKSVLDEELEWSDGVVEAGQSTRLMMRTPDTYGNLVATWTPNDHWDLSLTGVYTGSMLVPHLAGYVEDDRLETTPDFVELNLKLGYKLLKTDHFTTQFSAGVQNILNSYQSDFDQGAYRDGAYIYGPARPRTFFVGVKFGHFHE